jgi:hypothetical protein
MLEHAVLVDSVLESYDVDGLQVTDLDEEFTTHITGQIPEVGEFQLWLRSDTPGWWSLSPEYKLDLAFATSVSEDSAAGFLNDLTALPNDYTFAFFTNSPTEYVAVLRTEGFLHQESLIASHLRAVFAQSVYQAGILRENLRPDMRPLLPIREPFRDAFREVYRQVDRVFMLDGRKFRESELSPFDWSQSPHEEDFNVPDNFARGEMVDEFYWGDEGPLGSDEVLSRAISGLDQKLASIGERFSNEEATVWVIGGSVYGFDDFFRMWETNISFGNQAYFDMDKLGQPLS